MRRLHGWLDGQAVMACLVPAPQAHNAEVVTIEGLATQRQGRRRSPSAAADLHRSRRGAMRLLHPGHADGRRQAPGRATNPDLSAIQTALSGNICRCTGYRKIFDAVKRWEPLVTRTSVIGQPLPRRMTRSPRSPAPRATRAISLAPTHCT